MSGQEHERTHLEITLGEAIPGANELLEPHYAAGRSDGGPQIFEYIYNHAKRV